MKFYFDSKADLFFPTDTETCSEEMFGEMP